MIVADQKEAVAAYVVSKVRDMASANLGPYYAIGTVKDGRIIGGVIYSQYIKLPDGSFDVQFSCAGEPGWLSKSTLRTYFGYAFHHLRCSRITAIAAKPNKRSRQLCERLGFVLEGKIRGCFGVGRDGILYGMTAAECRWIR